MIEVQHVAITRPDGSLALMQFVTNDGVVQREATDAAINAAIAKAGITAASWRRITLADIPVSRVDRDAWQDSGTVIAVNAARKAAVLDARRNHQVDILQSDAWSALATALFQVNNDVRVLKGQVALTPAQFRASLKSLLP